MRVTWRNRVVAAVAVIGMAACVVATAASLAAQGRAGQRGRGQGGGPGGGVFHTDVPAEAGSVVLGRPTRTSITVSLMTAADTAGVLVWGSSPKSLPETGTAVALKAGEPQHVVIDGLRPDSRYYYELRSAKTGQRILPVSAPGSFSTARPAGAGFTFTITADSHLDGNTNPETYLKTLVSARGDAPDFHIDLGDTFMTDKHASRDDAFKQYLAQRYYLGSLAQAAALFLVIGNHDGEQPRGRGADPDGQAVWSARTRNRYFPNPAPDGFYSGNAVRQPAAGTLQDYYAWEWGDALFVVLDPFWFSQETRGQGDNWSRSLGAEQYQWLKRTLEGSKASLKFIFIHHLVGGADPQSRGGAEAAALFEWGGKNPDGTDGFRSHRSGWPAPIHQLLVQNHVNAVFHGHDHLFVKQDLDGIVYQEVPQPGNPRAGSRSAAEYGYKSGTILAGTGYLRVIVSGKVAKVQYVNPEGHVQHTYALGGGDRDRGTTQGAAR